MKSSNFKNLKLTKYFKINNLLLILIIYLMIALIINPSYFIASASEGIKLWAINLLPALFPFLVITKLIVELDLLEPFTKFTSKIMKKLFNTNSNSGYLFIISILSGYPIGSKIVADAYKKGKIDYTELHRLITFTSVSGPLFIIGTVGINMLSNSLIGYIIIFSHIISAIINGIIYKNYTPPKNGGLTVNIKQHSSNNVLTNSIKNSVDAILQIGGLVCIFYVGMDAISSIIPLNAITQGAFEITKGCYEVSISNLTDNLKTIICTGIITFGGFCIHSQAMTFLKECNISYKFFLKQKISQTIIAIIIATILSTFIL